MPGATIPAMLYHGKQLSTISVVSFHPVELGRRVQRGILAGLLAPELAHPFPDVFLGAAPFRRRKLRRNLGTLPLTSAQATAIATAWLATYSNPTNKVEVELRAVRDANGNKLPLHQVRADANLYIPELAVRGQQLSGGPAPGVNCFWIAETTYQETATGDIRLTLQVDNYADRAVALLARLQIADEARQRRRGVYRPVQSPGA